MFSQFFAVCCTTGGGKPERPRKDYVVHANKPIINKEPTEQKVATVYSNTTAAGLEPTGSVTTRQSFNNELEEILKRAAISLKSELKCKVWLRI